jgi:hypothetical protein
LGSFYRSGSGESHCVFLLFRVELLPSEYVLVRNNDEKDHNWHSTACLQADFKSGFKDLYRKYNNNDGISGNGLANEDQATLCTKRWKCS